MPPSARDMKPSRPRLAKMGLGTSRTSLMTPSLKRADFIRCWQRSGLKTPDKPKIFIKKNGRNHSYHQFYPVSAKIRINRGSLYFLILDYTSRLFCALSIGSEVVLRTSCINSINKLRGATVLRQILLICLSSHAY